MLDTLLLRPSLYFTQLHFTSLHLSTLHFLLFKLHPTTLLFGFPHLNFLLLHFTSRHYTSPHVTTLHLTSLHYTFRLFLPHFYSFHFTPFKIAFLILFLTILGLQGNVPNTSAGSCFQFLMVLFIKAYLPISILCFLSLTFWTW
jgi:hypothetical protein